MKSALLAVGLLVGCGGVSTVNMGDAGDAGVSDSPSNMDAAPPDGGASQITITLAASCPSLTPCGGDVTGTWDLSAGCINDPLATAKMDCPTLVVNSEVANAGGSVTFLNGFVTRNYTTHYAMDVTVPAICLQGATCAQVQALDQMYIPNTTCTATGNGGCECVGSVNTAATQASSYTLVNNEVVSAGGDHYAYCVNVSGTQMQYHHTQGPTPELGTYTLTKQ